MKGIWGRLISSWSHIHCCFLKKWPGKRTLEGSLPRILLAKQKRLGLVQEHKNAVLVGRGGSCAPCTTKGDNKIWAGLGCRMGWIAPVFLLLEDTLKDGKSQDCRTTNSLSRKKRAQEDNEVSSRFQRLFQMQATDHMERTQPYEPFVSFTGILETGC